MKYFPLFTDKCLREVVLAVILYSRLVELKTCLTFASPTASGLPQCLSDPRLLSHHDLSIDPNLTKNSPASILCMITTSYTVDASMLSSYQARSSTEYTLCQLLTLYADLNLTETFYIDSASNGTPLGKFQVHKSRFQISKAPTRITGESFVVPDDISSDAEVEDVKVSKRSPTLQHQRKDDPRTVSLEWLALIIRIKTAAPVKGRSSNRSSSPAKSSLDVLKNLAQITEYVERKLAGISTL